MFCIISYHATQIGEIFHILQLFLMYHTLYREWLPLDSHYLNIATFSPFHRIFRFQLLDIYMLHLNCNYVLCHEIRSYKYTVLRIYICVCVCVCVCINIYVYIYMRFVVLTAAFQRIQVVCVDAVSLCEWFPTLRKWVLRSFETSGSTDQTTQPIIPENLNPHFTASLHVNAS
jgi:hypothetical protein